MTSAACTAIVLVWAACVFVCNALDVSGIWVGCALKSCNSPKLHAQV